MSGQRIVIFGEALFDHFPDGSRVLGGAPFNVAWHLQAFGLAPLFVSRVGNDPEGDAIRRAMREWGMDTAGLQTDTQLPTGRVNVELISGEPSYEIVHPAAFDAIRLGEESAAQPTLLYHGTLAAREGESRTTLQRWRAGQPGRVFIDVNLRPPWWRREEVLRWLQGAHWVKLSGSELLQLAPEIETGRMKPADFLDEHGFEGMILTHGSSGAESVVAGNEPQRVRPDRSIEVLDTVGAGDAFAAVVIVGLVREWPVEKTLQRSQAFASALCARRGAIVRDMEFYRAHHDAWGSD